ncbi:MAG: winged helix-turn-helix transcriptional regulator [Methanomassiliicoccales archaeon]|nr:MAG: winged helix-turn-helix transcriptional regulator [Methanomassiliicoccales archaeon]
MKDPLALENRRRIFEHIGKKPGTHIREMERELGLSIGVLTYHLDQLEMSGLIRSEGENRKSYFRTKDFTKADRQLIANLRSKRAEQIALALLEKDGLSFREIREKLRVSNSTLSYHMGRLERMEIVTTSKVEREKVYHLKDREAVHLALMTIEKTEDPVAIFIRIWDALSKKE